MLVEEVQQILGHVNIATTMIYAEVSKANVKKMIIDVALYKSGITALILYSRPVYPGNGGNNERD